MVTFGTRATRVGFATVDGHPSPAKENPLTAQTSQQRQRLIGPRLSTAYARDQVARALHDAVVEGFGFGPYDLPAAADREWMRAAMAIPIRQATEAALEVLGWSVTHALENAPDGLMGRYEASHHPGRVDAN
jgi:hypothetical protein